MELLIALDNSIPDGVSIPNQFQILPMGLVHSQKGDFLVDNESFTSIRKDFKERQLHIPVDYEHQTLKDVEAPAAGWITDLALKRDGVYAVVNWTDRATEYLRNREYRYCSPVIIVRGSDRKALKLHSVALTNKPAIDAMIPIVNKNGDSAATSSGAAATSDGAVAGDNVNYALSSELAELAQLLQLPATATPEDIYKTIAALITQWKEVALKVDAAEFEAYKARVEKTVEQGMREGKLLPYQKDWAFRQAMNDIGEFSLWLKSTPQIVPMGELAGEHIAVPSCCTSPSDQLLGLTNDDIKQYR